MVRPIVSQLTDTVGVTDLRDLWESGRDPEFSTIYGRIYQVVPGLGHLKWQQAATVLSFLVQTLDQSLVHHSIVCKKVGFSPASTKPYLQVFCLWVSARPRHPQESFKPMQKKRHRENFNADTLSPCTS